jgi:hypothetical protein
VRPDQQCVLLFLQRKTQNRTRFASPYMYKEEANAHKEAGEKVDPNFGRM